MTKSFTKIISLLLIIGMNWSAISLIAGTDAYFHDTEISPNNLFSAAKLDLSIELLTYESFRTQTQGGWSSVANGDNPGAYRDENFDGAFPDGLVVGDDSGEPFIYHALFTSSSAIQEFLPTGGTSAPFTDNYLDPTGVEGTEAGILAGQIVALTLNVGFDNYDPDFGVSQSNLQDLYANSSETQCENMTVGEVLAEANFILSGQTGLFDPFSPSEISECVDEINNKFVDGEVEEETKVTPDETVLKEIIIEKHEGLNFQHILEIEQVSESSDLCVALEVEAYLDGSLMFDGYLTELFNDPILFSESADEWELYISLDENAPSILSDQTCEFKYIVSGWQENIVSQGGGFSDVEEIVDSVDSGEWTSCSMAPPSVYSSEFEVVAMNEFLPNPEGFEYGFDFGTDHSEMPQGEWVELYNNDGITGYDLSGWYFKDMAGNIIDITAGNSSLNSTVIPASSWMVIYMNKAILNNTGVESITLYNANDEIVDSYIYFGNDYCDLTPTPEGQNIDDHSGSCSGVPPNKSYARIPNGFGGWVDPIPTPGGTNETEENLIIAGLEDLIDSDGGGIFDDASGSTALWDYGTSEGNDADDTDDGIPDNTTDSTPENGANEGDDDEEETDEETKSEAGSDNTADFTQENGDNSDDGGDDTGAGDDNTTDTDDTTDDASGSTAFQDYGTSEGEDGADDDTDGDTDEGDDGSDDTGAGDVMDDADTDDDVDVAGNDDTTDDGGTTDTDDGDDGDDGDTTTDDSTTTDDAETAGDGDGAINTDGGDTDDTDDGEDTDDADDTDTGDDITNDVTDDASDSTAFQDYGTSESDGTTDSTLEYGANESDDATTGSILEYGANDADGDADTGDKEEASEETNPEAGDDGSEETKPEVSGDDTTGSAPEDGGDSDGGLGGE